MGYSRYSQVFVMPEGLLGWKRSGKPLERAIVAAEP
jgi:hypothetical protein